MGDSSDEDMLSAEGGDDDVALPRATVFKLIKEMMPKDLRCANETRDLILQCCTEFIHLLASEANEVCEREGRKTIAPDHVLTSLKKLGFEDYVAQTSSMIDEHKEEKQRRTEKIKKKNTNISPEELARQQRELFAQVLHDSQTLATPQQRELFAQARMRSNSQMVLPQAKTSEAAAATDAAAEPESATTDGGAQPAPALAKREQQYDEDEDYDA